MDKTIQLVADNECVNNKLRAEIDGFVEMLESIRLKINRPHDKAVWMAAFSHSEVIVLEALIAKHKG